LSTFPTSYTCPFSGQFQDKRIKLYNNNWYHVPLELRAEMYKPYVKESLQTARTLQRLKVTTEKVARKLKEYFKRSCTPTEETRPKIPNDPKMPTNSFNVHQSTLIRFCSIYHKISFKYVPRLRLPLSPTSMICTESGITALLKYQGYVSKIPSRVIPSFPFITNPKSDKALSHFLIKKGIIIMTTRGLHIKAIVV